MKLSCKETQVHYFTQTLTLGAICSTGLGTISNARNKVLKNQIHEVTNLGTVRARIQGPSLLQDPTTKIQIKDPCRNKTVLYKTLSIIRPTLI